MSNYKEIVTKTIVGKGKKTSKDKYVLQTEEIPDTVLGCWIINHRFQGTNKQNEVDINGSFDINVWYSYDNNSKTSVTTKTYNYEDSMKLRIKDMNALNNDNEIIVRSLKQPTVQDVKIVNNQVELNIEKELGVEIVGESKVKIAIEEDEMPWDEIYDDDQTIDNVNEEYIKNN